MRNNRYRPAVLAVGLLVGNLGLAQEAVVDPVSEYAAKCASTQEFSLECEYLRGLVRGQIVDALEVLEQARDKRAIEEALEALEIDDEPEIWVAALRILGRFPDDPRMGPAVLPFLTSSYVKVQEMAARALTQLDSDPRVELGEQWIDNHQGISVESPWDEEPEIPEAFGQMGFPAYPGASRFSVADSDRSVGWMTPDPAQTVVRQMTKMLRVQPIGWEEWTNRQQEEQTKAFESIDYSAMEKIQELMEEYIKTQDPKILEKAEALQKKFTEPMDQLQEGSQQSVVQVATPPGSVPPEEVRFFIAEERDGHVARLVLVYRQPLLKKTVIQMAWDLRDYPSLRGEER